jgi:hypothetical protein
LLRIRRAAEIRVRSRTAPGRPMKLFALIFAFTCFFAPLEAFAQLTERRVERVESRVDKLERAGRNYGPASLVAGVLAALWAQNTRRNAWLWFFLGVFFAPITLLVLLYKNSADIDRRKLTADLK